jgi:hypothetical protein
MFRRLGKSLGRFEIYACLYHSSHCLRIALVETYDKLLRFCLNPKKVFVDCQSKKLQCRTFHRANGSTSLITVWQGSVAQVWQPAYRTFPWMISGKVKISQLADSSSAWKLSASWSIRLASGMPTTKTQSTILLVRLISLCSIFSKVRN